MALSDDPFATIKFAFDAIQRGDALQRKKAGYPKALAPLDVWILPVGNEHNLPDKVSVWTHCAFRSGSWRVHGAGYICDEEVSFSGSKDARFIAAPAPP